MNFWLQWIAVLWPIAATITPFVLAGGFLWLRSQFAGSKAFDKTCEDVAAIKTDITLIETRLDQLGKDIDSSPTRQDMMTKIGMLSERLGKMEANGESMQRQMLTQTQALERQLATLSQYVHTLVERGMHQ